MSNPLEVRISWYRPEPRFLFLTEADPAYTLYKEWEETGSDEVWDEFVSAVDSLCDEHVVAYTRIDEVAVE